MEIELNTVLSGVVVRPIRTQTVEVITQRVHAFVDVIGPDSLQHTSRCPKVAPLPVGH